MKKIVKRLVTEYKAMHKPTFRTLVKDTARITGTAMAAAVILKIVDTGFASLLDLFL